jgi:glycosyltransferase involved in cell wall biosynthesis
MGLIRESLRAVVKNCFWSLDPFLRLAIRRTSVILYANADFAPAFRSHKSKIRIRPYAGSFASQSESHGGSNEGIFRVLWVGRFVPMKGLIPAIEGFARFLQSARPDPLTELVIVGEGPLRTYLSRLVTHHGITEFVRVVPWMDQEKLGHLYDSSSVFLYPSVEAQGLVVAEALSFGLPVVALDGTGPSFLKGPAGWTVRFAGGDGSGAALASSLADAYRLWQLGKLRHLQQAATDRYESYLDWSRIVDDVVAAYQSAAAETSTRK